MMNNNEVHSVNPGDNVPITKKTVDSQHSDIDRASCRGIAPTSSKGNDSDYQNLSDESHTLEDFLYGDSQNQEKLLEMMARENTRTTQKIYKSARSLITSVPKEKARLQQFLNNPESEFFETIISEENMRDSGIVDSYKSKSSLINNLGSVKTEMKSSRGPLEMAMSKCSETFKPQRQHHKVQQKIIVQEDSNHLISSKSQKRGYVSLEGSPRRGIKKSVSPTDSSEFSSEQLTKTMVGEVGGKIELFADFSDYLNVAAKVDLKQTFKNLGKLYKSENDLNQISIIGEPTSCRVAAPPPSPSKTISAKLVETKEMIPGRKTVNFDLMPTVHTISARRHSSATHYFAKRTRRNSSPPNIPEVGRRQRNDRNTQYYDNRERYLRDATRIRRVGLRIKNRPSEEQMKEKIRRKVERMTQNTESGIHKNLKTRKCTARSHSKPKRISSTNDVNSDFFQAMNKIYKTTCEQARKLKKEQQENSDWSSSELSLSELDPNKTKPLTESEKSKILCEIFNFDSKKSLDKNPFKFLSRDDLQNELKKVSDSLEDMEVYSRLNKMLQNHIRDNLAEGANLAERLRVKFFK